ncbi:MAG TPA: helix-turn-helix transcriptional regulator, partial [Labilithrix sp.]|nr:helix-turn-helix transcriptional regulator [Labilithrix sp.]
RVRRWLGGGAPWRGGQTAMSAREWARVTHALLDAVGDPAAFEGALAESMTSLDAVAVHGFLIRKSDGADLTSVQIAPTVERRDHFEDYERRWRATDPRYLVALRRPDEAHSDVAVIDGSTFERSAMYNENLRHSGVRYTLFGSFSVSTEHVLPIAYLRTKEAGPFQQCDVDFLTELSPSIGRAFRLHQLVSSLAADNRDLREALDQMPHAVAIVGPGRRVRASNHAASALLTRGDGLRTERGLLSACHPDDARRLDKGLAAAFIEAKARTRRSAVTAPPSVSIRRTRGLPLEVLFLPLGAETGRAPSEHVMVVINDPERAVTLDASRVASMYGLTATEAEIAVALATGHTLTQIAAERGCSEQTLRTHAKRILSKTGQHRQADLVRLLLTGPAVLGRRP